MGLFHHHESSPGPQTSFTVMRGDDFVTFVRDDFAEITTTADKLEMERLVDLGWLLLDESTGPGAGPGRIEFHMSGRFTGGRDGQAARAVPVELPPDDVTVYTVGYLKDGAGSSTA
jgi:hypothetical protein